MRGKILLALIFVCLAAVPGRGQVVTSSTGAINGTVLDNTKAILPGVNVKIESPAMIGGPRDAVTDGQGKYQFAAIPPGEYTVTFALTGFATVVRQNIRVNVGFTATLAVEMQVASQEETITVTGASPVVDTASTSIVNNFDARTMADLPTARDFIALMAATSAVTMTRIDVGGSAAMNENGFRVYGMTAGGGGVTGTSNQLMTEGISANSLTNLYNDFNMYAEVEISTAGHTAEMPVFGVFSNVISKSGGNTYSGNLFLSHSRSGWAARNIDDRQIALGIKGGPGLDARDTNVMDQYKDINGGVGGYVMKDKMWWFTSLRHTSSDVRYPNYPVEPQYTRVRSFNTKWTYNLTKNNKLIGFYNYNKKYQPQRLSATSIYVSSETPLDEDFPVGQYKGEYDSVLSNSMFLEVRVGSHGKDFTNYSRAPQSPSYTDLATQEVRGGVAADNQSERKRQMNGSFSYFRNGFGAHNFKIGWEVAQYPYWQDWFGRVSRETFGKDNNPPPDVQLRLQSGAPSEVILRLSPSSSQNIQWSYSAYINDAWQANNHFSFNLGIRFDRYRNALPDQVLPVSQFNPTEQHFSANDDVFHFNTWGPRLGVVWNLRGDGRTLVKANWGSYATRPPASVTGQNPNPPEWTKRYRWNDSNGDLLWQPGEEGQLLAQSGGITNELIDPNWVNEATREFLVVLERELVANFGVRTGMVWRGNVNPRVTLNPNRPFSAYNVPVTVRDPGPDGVLGNADDGPSFAALNLDPAYINVPLVNMTTNNSREDAGDDHYTWEISGNKRMSRNWALTSSFAYTWSRAGANATNPDMLINTESDGRFHYTSWQAKFGGTLAFAHDIKVSPVVQNQSGDNFARTIQASLNFGAQTIPVEPRAARRVSNVTMFNTRVEKGFRVMGTRLAGFIDLYNILNANPEENVIQSSGSTFLRPTRIVGPRTFTIGGKFDW